MMYIGVDIHKTFCQTTVMDEKGKVVRTGKIPTNRKDLQAFFSRYGNSKAVIESNTVWEFVYEVLDELGLDVELANPLQTKAIAQARVKTDKVDSNILAHLLRTDLVPASYIPPEKIRELRKDVRGRKRLKDLSTSLKNQIYAELIRKGIEYPPGILGSFKGIKWVEEQLPEPRVRRRLALLKIMVKELDEYNRELLLPAYDENKDAQLLATIQGVGFYTALTVLAEIGDVERFPDSDSIVSYSGLAPRVSQSGTTCRLGSITKAGPHHLRWVLVEAIHSHLRYCKDKDVCKLCKFYRRVSRRRGKHKAAVAGAAKLLRIMYWMLKMKEPYRPQGLDSG